MTPFSTNDLRNSGIRKRKPHMPPHTMRGYNHIGVRAGASLTPNAPVIPDSPKIHSVRLFASPPMLPAAKQREVFFRNRCIDNFYSIVNSEPCQTVIKSISPNINMRSETLLHRARSRSQTRARPQPCQYLIELL